MKKFLTRSLFFLALFGFILQGCSRENPDATSFNTIVLDNSSKSLSSYEEGLLEVEFSESMTQSIVEAQGDVPKVLQESGIVSLEPVFEVGGKFESRHREAGLHRFYTVCFENKELAFTKAGEPGSIPGAQTISLVRRARPSGRSIPFNDRYNTRQWYLANDGTSSYAKAGIDINVVPVWEKYTAGSGNVVVAVIDAGVNLNHPDLQAVCLPEKEGGSKSFFRNGSTIIPDDHGTFVAGLIGAINNNSDYVSSVAGGKDGKGGVKLMSCEIFQGEKTGKIAEAIKYACDNGALIAQNSWGIQFDTEKEAKEGEMSAATKAAIDYFIEYAGIDENGNQVGLMKGGIVIFAAGNDNFAYGHPASYEKVLSVGSIGPKGEKSAFSNYGDWVDICAPGGNSSAYPAISWETSLIGIVSDQDKLAVMDGTSMACPLVSGVAALLLSYYGGPGFTPEMLRSMILSGANYDIGVKDKIGPLVNAAGAFSTGTGIPLINTDYNGNYYIQGHEILEVIYNIRSYEDQKVSLQVDCGPAATYTIKDNAVIIRFNDGSGSLTGDYQATIKARNSFGETERKINYKIFGNNAPILKKTFSDQYLDLKSDGLNIALNEYFYDLDKGDVVSYSVSSEGGQCVNLRINEDNTLLITALKEGVDTISITATDLCGATRKASFRLAIYNSETGPNCYPNPVLDFLHVVPGMSTTATVRLYSSMGYLLFEKTEQCDYFNPIIIDMGSYAPGLYRLSASYEGKTYTKSIIK